MLKKRTHRTLMVLSQYFITFCALLTFYTHKTWSIETSSPATSWSRISVPSRFVILVFREEIWFLRKKFSGISMKTHHISLTPPISQIAIRRSQHQLKVKLLETWANISLPDGIVHRKSSSAPAATLKKSTSGASVASWQNLHMSGAPELWWEIKMMTSIVISSKARAATHSHRNHREATASRK